MLRYGSGLREAASTDVVYINQSPSARPAPQPGLSGEVQIARARANDLRPVGQPGMILTAISWR